MGTGQEAADAVAGKVPLAHRNHHIETTFTEGSWKTRGGWEQESGVGGQVSDAGWVLSWLKKRCSSDGG